MVYIPYRGGCIIRRHSMFIALSVAFNIEKESLPILRLSLFYKKQMRRFLGIFVLLFALPAIGGVQIIYIPLSSDFKEVKEAFYRDALADFLKSKGISVKIEVKCKGGRCDILTDKYAIEVDKASKWHEAIGQALHYGAVLNRKSAIAIYNDTDLSAEKMDALKRTTSRRRIEVFILKLQPFCNQIP